MESPLCLCVWVQIPTHHLQPVQCWKSHLLSLNLHFFISWDVTELIVTVYIKASCELKHATWVLAVIMSRTHPEGLKLPYCLRKWPICIATWIFTVNDFDWDSNASTVGQFHSLKTQLVQQFGICTEICLEIPAGLSGIVLQNQVGESFYHFCSWICFKPLTEPKLSDRIPLVTIQPG